MYVVTVLFDVDPGHVTEFMAAMLANALDSRTVEPGCRQFDVCTEPGDATKVFLYEVYDDPAAFEAHGASAHFRTFDARVATGSGPRPCVCTGALPRRRLQPPRRPDRHRPPPPSMGSYSVCWRRPTARRPRAR